MENNAELSFAGLELIGGEYVKYWVVNPTFLKDLEQL
jgi:hypothetical protein